MPRRVALALALVAALALCSLVAPGTQAERPQRDGSTSHRGARTPAGREVQLATFEQAWKRVRDMHYDEAMNGINWDDAREELLPRARAARTADELRPVLQSLLAKLGESHYQVLPGDAYERLASLVDASGGEADGADSPAARAGDLGLDARIAGDEVLVVRVDADGPADRAGVRAGWILDAVGDHSMTSVLAAAREALADPRLARIHGGFAIAHALAGPPESVARLRLTRPDGLTSQLDVRRRKQPGEVNQLGNLPPLVAHLTHGILPGTRVGYVRFNIFLAPVAPLFSAAMDDFVARDVEAVIVDLRGNPGGVGAMVMHWCPVSGELT